MILEKIYQNINLKEDIKTIKHYAFLLLCYPNISVKELAHHLFLPVPIVSAIKNELKKKKIITVNSGIVVTDEGEAIIRQELKIEHISVWRVTDFIKLVSNRHLQQLNN